MTTETTPALIDPKSIKWDKLESYGLSEDTKADLRNFMLNQPPTQAWIKKHPVYKNDYLPIDKVEFLLTVFFKSFKVEIKSVFQIANSICVTIRLYYGDNWQDGGGAAPMQVDSGSNAMDANSIKPNAVMLALPIAETNAVKDAADKIGRIFGRDLNRKDTLPYDYLIKDVERFKDAKITERNGK